MVYHIKEKDTDVDPLRIQAHMKITEDLLWYLSCIEEEHNTLENEFSSVEDIIYDFCICELQVYERDGEAIKELLQPYLG